MIGNDGQKWDVPWITLGLTWLMKMNYDKDIRPDQNRIQEKRLDEKG